ncbi:M15 family metallopeptidase [Streptomyces sp. NPDC004111]|uniref:M15 family metallopeptidase n=1 Tax=Streptomyces sp. NPDC004111 TaxID=3364690 RepID=UPI0036CC3C6D
MRETKRSGSLWAAGGLALAAAVGVGSAAVLAPSSDGGLGARTEMVTDRPGDARTPGGPAGGRNGDGAADQGNGAIPAGRTLTPFDTGHSALKNLDPALLKAVQQAAKDAKSAGVDLFVTAGWRSKEYQQRLLDQGVEKYGSLEQARQFVQTPEKSRHTHGAAIDIGPTNADDWLIRKGAAYGLCQVYANEMWHFELRTEPGGTCPELEKDASG